MEFEPSLPEQLRIKRTEDYLAERIATYEPYFDTAIPQLLEGLDYDSWETLDHLRGLLSIVDPNAVNDRELLGICYNSFRVGWLIADAVTDYELRFSLVGIIDGAATKEVAREQIIETTQSVMARSPLIDRLVAKYHPEIDRSGRYGHHVETFAALAIGMTESATFQMWARGNEISGGEA